MHKLVKPNGQEIDVNETSLEYALSLGWKKKRKAPAKKPAKKAE